MSAPRQTILYSGSFNPPHRGHIAVADRVLDIYPDADLWLAVTPRNPLKDATGLAPEQDRLEMTRIAAQSARHRDRITVTDIEFGMPRPSATIDTLDELARRYPDRSFSLLIGSDNAAGFCRWIRYKEILKKYPVLVYPREGYPLPDDAAQTFTVLTEAPLQPGTGTEIRRRIAAGGDGEDELPPGVEEYIREHHLYGHGPQEDTAALDSRIIDSPGEPALYLQRGKLHHRAGRFDRAYNDFVRVLELDPGNAEAEEYIALLREIFAFRDPDRYNP